jgi:hypothetical protein
MPESLRFKTGKDKKFEPEALPLIQEADDDEDDSRDSSLPGQPNESGIFQRKEVRNVNLGV